MKAERVQRRTFYWLVCESCGRCEPPPPRLASPITAPTREPMRCEKCGELLLLVEAWIAPETTMWQSRPGAMWHHVAFPDQLPDRDGRQVWSDA